MQEHDLDRTGIRTHAAGEADSSGTVVSGAGADDVAAGERPGGVRQGRITVSIDTN